jgi:predicted neutral ceramidase superfamily lipid hydrolase
MKSFDFSFLKNIERRVLILTMATFFAVFTGGLFGDMLRGNELNFTYAFINAFFISLSLGAVITITKTRNKDSEKKSYREIKEKKKKRK